MTSGNRDLRALLEHHDDGAPARARDNASLRVALLAAPMEAVPPVAYGGTERVVAALADELTRSGHEVTVFASGDSEVAAELVPITPVALWRMGYRGDVAAYQIAAVARCWREAHRFDLIHSHVEAFGFLMARHAGVPVVSTLHNRLDGAGMPELLAEFSDIPLVAISASQRRWAPGARWMGVVHNGLPLARMPLGTGDGAYLAFVGRVAREKGVAEAIDLAERVGKRLRMAARAHDRQEAALFEGVVQPAVERGAVEFLGELVATARDPLYAQAEATLLLGAWPEPFGLVAIESMACGTPVIARRAGALPEIVEHGVDGFLVDDLDEAELAVRLLDRLDRRLIRNRALARFSASRMARDYEEIYRRVLGQEAETGRRLAAARLS
jgi:glycosyltransferase involved in cell wall biosynthesis